MKLVEFAGQLFIQIRDWIQPALLEQSKRMGNIEKRLDHIEKNGGAMVYRGVFQRAMSYEKGNMVTHQGSAWIALRDTDAKPGDGDAWQLAVKGNH